MIPYIVDRCIWYICNSFLVHLLGCGLLTLEEVVDLLLLMLHDDGNVGILYPDMQGHHSIEIRHIELVVFPEM